jgi:hypothetical protein
VRWHVASHDQFVAKGLDEIGPPYATNTELTAMINFGQAALSLNEALRHPLTRMSDPARKDFRVSARERPQNGRDDIVIRTKAPAVVGEPAALSEISKTTFRGRKSARYEPRPCILSRQFGGFYESKYYAE